MRPDLEQYYLIDQYLENKLKGEQLTAFENQLLIDSSLARDVYEQRMLNDLILEAELKSVRGQIEKDLASIQNPSFFRMHWKWIATGLLSISSILYFNIKKDTDNRISQSSVIALEHTAPSVIEESKEHTIQTSNDLKEKKQATLATAEINPKKSETATALIDSIQLEKTDDITVANSPQVNPKTEPVPIIETKAQDCSLVKIACSILTEKTCNNAETGSIQIDKTYGGTAPYSYTLNNKKIKGLNIMDLAAGKYEIKISDRNGCTAEYTAIVSEKNCTQTIQQGAKFNINPSIGETCNIPFDTDKKGNVTIYNRSGKVIYSISNPSTNQVEWAGTEGYGALAEAGLYVYLVEYTDGTKVTGEVNIIR